MIHIVAWHGDVPHGVLASLVLALACVGPILAAIVLWGATRRLTHARAVSSVG